MIKIKDDTDFIDFNKATFFNQIYCVYDVINLSLELEDRLSNNIQYIDGIIVDTLESDRFFRFWSDDLMELNIGTYKYTLKILNNTTDEYDEYEIGILERESDINNDYKYSSDSNDDSDVFVY